MVDYLLIAEEAASIGGAVLRRYFRTSLAVETKEDTTVVSLADREAEQAIRDYLAQATPDIPVIGEEFGGAPAKRCWVVDPLDGTRAFLCGMPSFTVLIGLVQEGRPSHGVIHQPVLGESFCGNGKRAALNGKTLNARSAPSLSESFISTTAPHFFDANQLQRFERVRGQARDCIYGKDAYAYAMLASGHLDAVIEANLKAHDVMALIPVIEGAGGIVTTWDGNAPSIGDASTLVAAATTELHREIMQWLH